MSIYSENSNADDYDDIANAVIIGLSCAGTLLMAVLCITA